MMMRVSVGQNVRVVLRNGYKYKGLVEEKSDAFLKIHDEKLDNKVVVNAGDISSLEVLE